MCHKMRAVKYLLWSHCADMSSNVNSYHEPWSRDIHACVYVYYYSINTINGHNQNGSGLCLYLQNCTKVSIFANMRLLVFLLLINGRWNDLANLGQWKLTECFHLVMSVCIVNFKCKSKVVECYVSFIYQGLLSHWGKIIPPVPSQKISIYFLCPTKGGL